MSSGLSSKKAERIEEKSTEQLAEIASESGIDGDVSSMNIIMKEMKPF